MICDFFFADIYNAIYIDSDSLYEKYQNKSSIN
jgi:hypothetical protein